MYINYPAIFGIILFGVVCVVIIQQTVRFLYEHKIEISTFYKKLVGKYLKKIFAIKIKATYQFEGGEAKQYHLNRGAASPGSTLGSLDIDAVEAPIRKDYGFMFISNRKEPASPLDLDGYKEIQFESLEFNKRYSLYAPQEKIAWEFFSPNVMALLIDCKLNFSLAVFPNKLYFFRLGVPHDIGSDEFVALAKELSRIVA